jgi:hypothetical protein
MYCPKCGAQAADETKYCRACGQSLTLISQAMMKPLAADDKDQQKLEKAIKNISLGIGFLIVSIVVVTFWPADGNWTWGFLMLIAGIALLSIGVAGILGRAIAGSRPTSSVDRITTKETASILGELPSGAAAGELVGLTPPSGVTEVTTRNLEVGAGHLKDK